MTKWEQLAALLTGGNKPNPLLGMMAAQNPLYTADPTQTVDAARAFSQGLSSAAIGSIPGSGVVNAAGIQPRYDENWFIPAGITQGPNIRENLQSGNYLNAGLQGLGLLGDAASVGAMASMVPKSQQRGMVSFPDPNTFKGKMQIQGGALASKPRLEKIIQALENHGYEWKWADNGGITAYADVKGADGKWFKEGKHFNDASSLRTLRDWMGY